MGACSFQDRVARGDHPTADAAFSALQSEARYMHGHGGYTGTIAEKHGFVKVTMPRDFGTVREVIDFLDGDERWDEATKSWQAVDNRLRAVLGEREFDRWRAVYDDKWGPALCIETPEHWTFCGIASS